MDIGKSKHCMQRWANKQSFEQVKYKLKQDHILTCSITPKQHQRLCVVEYNYFLYAMLHKR